MSENPVTIDCHGTLVNIDAEDLHIGNVVVLQTGDIVPADLELIEARALEIDEFEITGEIMPVTKIANGVHSRLFRGSRIISGAGKGVAVAVGEQTEFGRIINQEGETIRPYQFRLIDKRYFWFIFALLPAFVIRLVQSQDIQLTIVLFFLFSAFILVVKNESLFKYLVILLESNRIKQGKIQIRDLSVLERMQDIDIICFDKTGVLTTRQMDINLLYFADRPIDADNQFTLLEEKTAQIVKTACALCNDILYFEKADRANPIDKALISFAQKKGVDVKAMLARYQQITTSRLILRTGIWPVVLTRLILKKFIIQKGIRKSS